MNRPPERFIRVPAKKNIPPGTKRPVYYDDACLGHDMKDPKTGKTYNASELYHYIGSSRGPDYELPDEFKETNNLYDSIPIGHIDEVASTYAYFDSNYGVMNDSGSTRPMPLSTTNQPTAFHGSAWIARPPTASCRFIAGLRSCQNAWGP